MKDIIYFDDGTNSIKRKQGKIDKIENGFVYFLEEKQNKIQMFSIYKIVRIELGKS